MYLQVIFQGLLGNIWNGTLMYSEATGTLLCLQLKEPGRGRAGQANDVHLQATF
ncbi:MAG: hypothetical protein JNM21_01310 [Taibaiella sp.]|nr:hypothetical protein [Taibaiella sp.]